MEKVPLNVRDIIRIRLFSRTYATISLLFIRMIYMFMSNTASFFM